MKILLILASLFFSMPIMAIGLGDWQNQTPGGNVMGDPGSGTVLTLGKNSQPIEHITRWYFFKNHIIGQTSTDYFIVNETTGEVNRFSGLHEWNRAIAKSALSPSVWTRWFSDNWKFYERMLFAIILFGMLTLFILLPLFWKLNRRISDDRTFQVKRTYLIAFVVLVVFAVARILLDIYPQSI